ncbi:phosphoribosylglycinamide formyltransferase [Nodosilinea sp. LEGE 07088]|uniref:phosphoribosylglycinamide formyltransferase n=1 Tax=Nodosilinea sp. LEGE 07088 TaxID=2777968 RepID=UPI001881F37F|nr:phosphoribosylglycinamide formyltransferase [Nodosilinea sp. LEGE 07088]MBE9137797.1 phosphoribosylglycinamide formyltransferase [Nodosilinea sp. LEGE 07088]
MLETPEAMISPPLPTVWPRFRQPLRLGVMASGAGTNLAAIAQSIQSGQLHAQIQVVVYNNPQAGVAVRSTRLGLPTVLLNHRDYASREALDGDIVQALQAHDVDWVIMAGWLRCVTSVLIDAFPQRILNIHPSLLPSFPGLKAVEQALAAGVTLSGCTVHHVELAVDSGPVVMQAAVPVQMQDTAVTLQARIQTQEHRIYPAAIALAAMGG